MATKANAAVRVFVALGGYQVRSAGSGCVISRLGWRLHITDLLNDHGRKLTEQLTHECALDTVARHALTRYETLTRY